MSYFAPLPSPSPAVIPNHELTCSSHHRYCWKAGDHFYVLGGVTQFPLGCNRATDALEQRPRRRIHKVLHRETDAGRHGGHETIWNRDVNAARNILMLLMLELLGMPRTKEFCKQLAERRR